jgi:hypothetical protein
MTIINPLPETCGACRWWIGFAVDDETPAQVGECRARPPQIMPGTGSRKGRWPLTGPNDACGFHKPTA